MDRLLHVGRYFFVAGFSIVTLSAVMIRAPGNDCEMRSDLGRESRHQVAFVEWNTRSVFPA